MCKWSSKKICWACIERMKFVIEAVLAFLSGIGSRGGKNTLLTYSQHVVFKSLETIVEEENRYMTAKNNNDPKSNKKEDYATEYNH